jgi:tetratricopeptide (TPR) repeat protein
VVIEKLPFLAVAIVSGLFTLQAENQSLVSLTGNLSFGFRLMNAFHSLVFYLWKMVWPFHLVPLYPYPHSANPFSFENILALLTVLAISLVCYRFREKAPYLVAAWFYYLVTLGPVLGVVQGGVQAAADRYGYLPSIGIFLLFSAGACALLRPSRTQLILLCTVLTIFFGYLTTRQIGVWKNSISLWKMVMASYPDDAPAFAHKNLGTAYQLAGRLQEALVEYDKAAALPPPDASAHSDKATVLFDLGERQGAIQELKTSLSLDPQYLPAHRNLAIIYQRMGMKKEAADEMQEVLKLSGEDENHE